MTSYLDDFLESINDLPGDIKRKLGDMRELDARSQELAERIDKQAKIHMSRAKRAVAQGMEPQDAPLQKIQKERWTLFQMGDEKIELANQMTEVMNRHIRRLDEELSKFELELREKQQLKNAPNLPDIKEDKRNKRKAVNKKEDTSSNKRPNNLSRRNSNIQPEDKPPPAREEEDEGEKDMSQMAVYPNAQLPIASKEESGEPLVGAIPAGADYIIGVDQLCAARTSGPKVQPQEWILASVVKYNSITQKYLIRDDDPGDDGDGPSRPKLHTISSRFVLPLPLRQPSHWTKSNEFPAGSRVLALFPDTTCFYKAQVALPPSKRRQHDYLVEFEDDDPSDVGNIKRRVPIKYVLRLPDSAV